MKRKLLKWIFVSAATILSIHASAQISGYYQQDFEGSFPPTGWQTVDVLDPANVWVQSTTDHYSGSHSAYINYTNYIPGEDWLILPQFTVALTDSFSFWLAANFVPYPPDSTVILVSTTDSNLSSFTNVLATLSEGDNYPTTADVFQYYAYSLAAYAGQNIYVAFKHTDNYGDGVFIDLVTIGSQLDVNASSVSIDLPDVVSTVTSIIPKATVKNGSLTTQSFTVTMTIPGGYTSTKDVTNLGAGATQQVDFDSWTASAVGPVAVSIQTQLAGDQAPADDTLSRVITAFDPLSGYYQEDFEGAFPPAGWQTLDFIDPSNVWMQSIVDAYSGANSAYINYNLFGEGEDWLVLPQFSVASTDSFSFWLAANVPGSIPDSTYILISTTDDYPSSFTTVLATLSDGDNYPTTAGVFQYYAYSLSAYAGQNIYVALKNRNNNGDGVFIDLVTIGTPLSSDVSAKSIDLPGNVSTATPIIPKATVKNNSLGTQSFSVTMTITGGYSSTKNVTNLAAGAVVQIDFDSWQPANTGAMTVSIQTQLAGDLNIANDTISAVVTAFDPLSGFYQEDFENSFPPVAWQIRNVSDQNNTWQQAAGVYYSGYSSAFIHWSPPAIHGEDWLILPQFTVAGTDSFSFWLSLAFTGFQDSTSILVSTTDSYLSSFTDTLAVLTDGDTYPSVYGTFYYYPFSLAAYAGQNIYVALKNSNLDGDGVFIDLASIGTPLGTGVTENTATNFSLSSYPNPFTKFTSLSFNLDHSAPVRISIVDVMGKEVTELCNKTFSAGPQQISWNASGYAAGVYFCKVSVDDKVTMQKLVKLNN